MVCPVSWEKGYVDVWVKEKTVNHLPHSLFEMTSVSNKVMRGGSRPYWPKQICGLNIAVWSQTSLHSHVRYSFASFSFVFCPYTEITQTSENIIASLNRDFLENKFVLFRGHKYHKFLQQVWKTIQENLFKAWSILRSLSVVNERSVCLCISLQQCMIRVLSRCALSGPCATTLCLDQCPCSLEH